MPENHRPHIAHLLPSLGNGGCENSLLELIPALPRYRHTVIAMQEPSPLAHRFTARDIEVTRLHQTGALQLAGYKRLYHTLRRLKPDLLLSYLPFADMVGRFAGQAAGVPRVVCSVRANMAVTPLGWPYLPADRLTSFLVNNYHFNSPAVSRTYGSFFKFPSSKRTVIPSGVTLPPTSSSAARAALGLAPDDKVIACVAHFRRQKGHRYLVKAADKLARTHLGLKILLVGSGYHEGAVAKLISSKRLADTVFMLGNRYDVRDVILPAADLFVLPTLYEGLSKALLEAAAAGLPIVTTDIAENRAVFNHGETALLVPKRDAQALARSISALLANPGLARRLGEASRAHVLQHYSLSRVADQWKVFLDQLLGVTRSVSAAYAPSLSILPAPPDMTGGTTNPAADAASDEPLAPSNDQQPIRSR